jgi:hypothetical protein
MSDPSDSRDPRDPRDPDVEVPAAQLDGEPAGAVRTHMSPQLARRFPFRFEGVVGAAARAFTFTAGRAMVVLERGCLTARFGPWCVETPLSNIAETSITGPYKPWKVAGPPHLSFVDRGLTFATNADEGVCLRFVQPVTGIEPSGRLRHPGLTVTVADPHGLIAAIESARMTP